MPDRLTEPYGDPLGVSSHVCDVRGGRVYCESFECPWCGGDDA